jgi:hypothetical protein
LYFGARPVVWVVLIAVAVWGGIATWRRMNRATQILATTHCPLRGEPRIVVSRDVPAEDSQPVRIHEEVHAQQCRTLGPIRYRLRNVIASGKLALEAPAYCAAADARLRAGLDSQRVSERLRDDMIEAMSDIADSSSVLASLREHCAGIVAVAERRSSR